MREFDAFPVYPPAKRIANRTILNRIMASYRDHEFYDGDRMNGYGGMVDDGRWGPVADNLVNEYHLGYSRVLQINAHKGFLLNELFKRGCRVTGTETSQYAIDNSKVRLHNCLPSQLPFEDRSFDFVICTSAVYGENLAGAIKILREIQRVGRGKSWVTLAAYENEADINGLMLLRYWFLNGTTILTKADWIEVLNHVHYTGDYRFDTAEYLNLERS